jgi:dethiobiotin synthetase
MNPGNQSAPDALAAHRPSQNQEALSETPQRGRLSILGTEFGCGKSVLMAGLTALLHEQGFRADAIKPIVIGSPHERNAEIKFIATVCKANLQTDYISLERAERLTNEQWQSGLRLIEHQADFTLIEIPGGCATALSVGSDAKPEAYWRDSRDLAAEIGAPCLLVAKHAQNALEQLRLNVHYLQARNLPLLGLATVETSPDSGRALEFNFARDQVELALKWATGLPYLGCIKYSESISVSEVRQGNLIKQSAGGLEILELLKCLNLEVPTGQG